jgi:hypothetical protein
VTSSVDQRKQDHRCAQRSRIEQKADRSDVDPAISGIRPTWASAAPRATWAAGERPFEGCPDRTRLNGARPASGPRARIGSACKQSELYQARELLL